MGPSGIFASSCIILPPSLDQTGQHREREADVGNNDDGGECPGKPAAPLVEPGVVPPDALEEAPGAVEDVEAEEEIGRDVEDGHPRPAEAGDQVGVHVTRYELRAGGADRQVQ